VKPDYKQKGYAYEEKKYPVDKPPEYVPQKAPVPEGSAYATTPAYKPTEYAPPAYPTTPPPYVPSAYPPPPPPVYRRK
jgi:hypothetical protein